MIWREATRDDVREFSTVSGTPILSPVGSDAWRPAYPVTGDGSAERLRREGLTVVESSENRGFGAGVNIGARGMVEDVLVLLNNDAVAEPGFLDGVGRAAGRRAEGRRRRASWRWPQVVRRCRSSRRWTP